MRAPDMPWLAWLVADSEAKRCIAETRLCGRASRLRPRLQSVMCLVRAPRHARRRAVQAGIASCVYGEYELSGTEKMAINPAKSTILSRRRQSWVMPGRPRAHDLDMSGFCRANTLSRTMAKEETFSMMSLMRILPPTAGGGLYGRGVVSIYILYIMSS